MLAVSPEDFLGRTLYELPLKESFIRESIDLIRSALDTGKIQHYIYDMVVPDGNKTYEARVVPYDSDSVLWISRDITDSIRKDEQLLQAQKMETVGNLAGGLAHDFNNVLGGIIGTTSLLKYSLASGQCEPAALIHDVDTIEEIAKRGADIVTQLLSVSRKRELSLDLIDLNQSVQQVITICRNTFDKSVAINVYPFELPCYISADRAQVEQVILNLCVNGYHSMTIMRGRGEKMGGELIVRVETVEDGSGFHQVHVDAAGRKFVSVVVSDTGVGMDSYVQSRIFDPFYTTKESIRGTGLGLTMVLNIVQQHGGFIDVFSEPGKGSTFRVSFPASDFALPDVQTVEAESVVHGSGLVLIIDDEDIIRETAARILEYCGYDVITAADGEKGVEIFRTEHSRISGIILDMSMPRMSGKDALVELRKIDPDVQVLLSSGFREDPRVQECFEIGIHDFVQKPFTMSELASRVHRLVVKEVK
jgi:signal transduction histidine kinase/ActR/RegA family two-component response regulator